MKISYEHELRNLQNWINNVNIRLSSVGTVTTDLASVNNTCYQINTIAEEIVSEYPFYGRELKNISTNLFKSSAYGTVTVNSAAFGELYIIISHIAQEPVDIAAWYEIHPRIVAISQELFCDGYYDSAAEKAIKEVETRLRELFILLIYLQSVERITAEVYNLYLKELLRHIEIRPLMKIYHAQRERRWSRLCLQVS